MSVPFSKGLEKIKGMILKDFFRLKFGKGKDLIHLGRGSRTKIEGRKSFRDFQQNL